MFWREKVVLEGGQRLHGGVATKLDLDISPLCDITKDWFLETEEK